MSDEDNNSSTEEEIQFFKKSIHDYLQLEDEISTIEKAIKARKEKRKQLSETILTFLQENEISHINLQGNFNGKQMKCATIKKKTSLNEKTIGTALDKYFDNKDEANKVLEAIINNRTEVEVNKLKLSKISNNINKTEQLSQLLEEQTDDNDIPNSMKYLYTKIE